MIPFRNRANKFWPIEVVRCDERSGFCPFVPESHQHASWLPPSWRLWRKKIEILNPVQLFKEKISCLRRCEVIAVKLRELLNFHLGHNLTISPGSPELADGMICVKSPLESSPNPQWSMLKLHAWPQSPHHVPWASRCPLPWNNLRSKSVKLWKSWDFSLLALLVLLVALLLFTGSQSWTRCFHPSISWHAWGFRQIYKMNLSKVMRSNAKVSSRQEDESPLMQQPLQNQSLERAV